MVDGQVICANRQCKVPEGGKCLDGFEPATKCPLYGRAPEEQEVPGSADSAASLAFDGLRLADGLPLEAVGATRVLGGLPARMIGLVGAYDSGKTSLIAGLFDLYQLGPVGGTTFAGSDTLHGFEAICHDARVASERDEPHSERTKRGEVRFYHLDVRHGGRLRSVLLADRSGEEYEEVADLAANASAMFELRRVDVVTILVDGRRLSTPEDRADAIGAIPLIIQGMVESRAFARKPDVAVVLTKHDVVASSPKGDRAMRDFEQIAAGLEERFADHFARFGSFVTCASPGKAGVVRGAGLAELLGFWLETRPQASGLRTRYSSGRVLDALQVEAAPRG